MKSEEIDFSEDPLAKDALSLLNEIGEAFPVFAQITPVSLLTATILLRSMISELRRLESETSFAGETLEQVLNDFQFALLKIGREKMEVDK